MYLYSQYIFLFLIIFHCLCSYSCTDFSPFAPLHPATPLTQAISPHTHCSCQRVMCISSLASSFHILYFTSPQVFYNLFVLLNPLTTSPITLQPFPSGKQQNTHLTHDSVSVSLVCLVVFQIQLMIDSYIFSILLFIVLIFFLNKSL